MSFRISPSPAPTVELPSLMSAVVANGAHATLASRPLPTPAAGEVLLRVALAGVCRTDIAAASGLLGVPQGRVLGHEFAGIVVSKHETLPLGTRVAVNPVLPCGACPACRARPSRLCAQPNYLGLHRDGAFATFVSVPSSTLLPIPDTLPWRHAAYLEPVAASAAVLQAHIHPRQTGLIYGDNRIAGLTQRILAAHGFERIHILGTGDTELPADAFDFAVETCPQPGLLARLLHAVRPEGTIVLKSRADRNLDLPLALAVRRRIVLEPVFYGCFTSALELLCDNRLDLNDLLGEALPIEAFRDAFERAESRKTFLVPDPEFPLHPL